MGRLREAMVELPVLLPIHTDPSVGGSENAHGTWRSRSEMYVLETDVGGSARGGLE
jgi:hypothetical protein